MMLPLGLRVSMRLLTAMPLRWDEREASYAGARCTVWFPLVGVLIGLCVWGVLLLPLPAAPRAALALAIWIVLTRGLHEDAVMDSADAAFALVDSAERARIRKDPHVGAHGVTAFCLLLLVRFAALTVVAPAAGFIAPVIGRWCMALTLGRYRNRHSAGLAQAFAPGTRGSGASIIGIAIILLVAYARHDARILAVTAIALGGGIASTAVLVRRLGSASGDVHGAGGVAAEVIGLYGMLLP